MDQIFEIVKAAFELLTGNTLDTMLVLGPFILGVFCIFITKHLKAENEDFSNPSLIQGEIVEITRSGKWLLPTIEYEKEKGKALLKSNAAIRHGQVGDVVNLEISKTGKVRLESEAHIQYAKILPFSAVVSFSFCALFLYLNFIK